MRNRQSHLRKSNYLVVLFLLLSMIFFYGLDKYAIFSIDDWPYSWVSEEDGSNYFSPLEDNAVRKHVDSIEDAVVSQSREYFRSNGRFLTHVIVQYLCGTMPMSTFVIINCIVFCAFLFCMMRFSLQKPCTVPEMLILLAGVWFLIPFKGMTFMGNIAMTVNYLWTTTATLLFLLLYLWLRQKCISFPLIGCVGLFILSVLVGSLQESFCIGFAGAFLFYLLEKWREKSIKLIDVTVSGGYIIGAIICVFSPANFSRASGDGIGFHFNVIYGLLASPAFDVFLLALIIFLMKRRNSFRCFLKDNFIFCLAFLFNLLFAIVIAYNGRHQLTCISVIALILTCRIWFDEFQISERVKITLACFITAAMILTYIPIRSLRMEYKDAYEEILAKAKKSDDGIIGAKNFASLTGKIHNMPLVDNYYVNTFSFFGSDCWEKCVSLMLTNGQDLYRLKQVLPDDPDVLANGCVKANEVMSNLWKIGGRYVSRSEKELRHGAFHLKVVSKPKAFFMRNVEKIVSPSESFYYKGFWYYVFLGDIKEVKSLEIKNIE